MIKTLNRLRQLAISQDPKFIVTLSKHLYHDDYQLFYRKGRLLVGLSGQGSLREVPPYELIVQGTRFPSGQELIDVLTCESIITGHGELKVTMKNGMPVVFYPKRLLVKSGICGL
jgi:hypothetical protein